MRFFSSSGHFVQVGKADVGFTDTIPGVRPEGVLELIGRCRIAWVTVQPALSVGLPGTEVAKISLVGHVCISHGVEQFVISPVPGSTVIVLLFVWNTVVDFFYETLEVAEVLESVVF